VSGPARTADERLLATFLELVRVDSPSGFESACARYCESALAELGCTVRYDSSGDKTGSDTGNLIAELRGTVDTVLVLSAHLDCVEPCRAVEAVVTDTTVFSAGDTVLGADDKAGLAAAIECVRRLVESGEAYPSVKCVFTVQEELGLVGAKHLSRADVAGDLCLVLDAEVALAKLGLFGMHLHGYGLPGSSSVAYGLTCLELEAGDAGVNVGADPTASPPASEHVTTFGAGS